MLGAQFASKTTGESAERHCGITEIAPSITNSTNILGNVDLRVFLAMLQLGCTPAEFNSHVQE
jgi:hypothetical protein